MRVLAAVLVLGLGAGACASVDAAAPPPSPPPVEPVAAVEIAQRLSASPDGRVPDLRGLEVTDATAAAAVEHARLRVIVIGPGTTISSQYPGPAEVLPADGMILVWRGAPPGPPETATPPAPPAPGVAAAEPEPEAPAEPAAPPPPPPTPPRVNPQRLPPTEPGTVLSGPASWYGEEFAGRTTACDDVFDPAALTLASRELRCGTVVRVSGPTGASVEAVVSDWGPAEWTGRRFDLSAATFAAIHHPGAGVISVTVEVLG